MLAALQVTATDGDQDRPQNIVYFLTGQGIDPDNPANSKFDINKTTGDIYVLKVRARPASPRPAPPSPPHRVRSAYCQASLRPATPRHPTPRLAAVPPGPGGRSNHQVSL